MTKKISILQLIRNSLKSESHDFTKGSVSESVILLAIPMILELSLESIFAIVDMFFVSRLGSNAIATVGLTESVVTLVYSISIGMSTGATALVARRVGEKNLTGAAHVSAQTLIVGLIASLIISFIGMYFAGDVLSLMGASQQVIQEGESFTRIMLGGSTAIILLFLINGIFRGAGDAAIAMKSLWIASGVNIILCPIFISFYGLKGAAIATVLGRSAGVIYQLLQFTKGHGVLNLKKAHFNFDFKVVKSLLEISWPASFQFLIGSGSWIILTKLVADVGGTSASAGYQIAFRNFVFFILPAWGLSNVAATLVGQNLGAKLSQRAEECVLTTNKYCFIIMALVTLFFWFLTEPIIRIFSQDEEVLHYGIEALRIIGSGYIFYGIGMVLTQALNGAGDTKAPTWMNVISFWFFQTPLAFILAKTFDMKSVGVVLSIPISNALLALLAWIYFKRGQWKKIKV